MHEARKSRRLTDYTTNSKMLIRREPLIWSIIMATRSELPRTLVNLISDRSGQMDGHTERQTCAKYNIEDSKKKHTSSINKNFLIFEQNKHFNKINIFIIINF